MILVHTTFKSFVKKLQENSDNATSPEEVRIKELGLKMQEFKSGQSKVDAILNKQPETWEAEAEKVIGTNEYLSMYWRITKIKRSILDNQKTLQNKSPEEVKMIQDTIALQTKQLKDLEKEFNTKIGEDKKLV
jgi:hypothetical protein